jgi:prepilin-type N-terminal cleavage/methylation domain-containing protein
MSHVDKQQGFTIIELMLAMSFVSILLVAIAMTVIQVSGIYNRGVILKDVNQIGRSLTEELRQSVSQTAAFDVGDGLNDTNNYIIQNYGGRLCTGKYSYIWNYGEALNNLTSQLNKYSSSVDMVRFVKVFDPTLEYCNKSAANYPSNIIPDGAIDLLNDSQHNLVLYKFSIASSISDIKTKQRLYSFEFVIGTNNISAIDLNTFSCKPPGELGSDPNYCSINRFNVTVRSGNAIN